ncbi:MAG: hypothetical protein MJZ97_07135 [Bacteroidales bacterium]|nr:hypothetical protein [Bacteroidales bacterium]
MDDIFEAEAKEQVDVTPAVFQILPIFRQRQMKMMKCEGVLTKKSYFCNLINKFMQS